MIKNVNTYNVSSLLINLQDNEPNRNGNRLNRSVSNMKQNKVKCNLDETLKN